MNRMDWLSDYSQSATPELSKEVLDEQPNPWSLPEEWDWYVFKLEELCLRSGPSEIKQLVVDYLKVAIQMQGVAWHHWREIKTAAEKEVGTRVLPTLDFLTSSHAMSRGYIDTIYVESIRTRMAEGKAKP